jgi:hypothetical protein
MKIWIPVFVLGLSVALSGCKPKETLLSGQVFVVNGNENIRLSLVEVQLIPKSNVVECLRQKLREHLK